MMMSKVAPAIPTARAATTTRYSASPGSASPRKTTATMTTTPASHSQLRRCPKRPIKGSRAWSTTGAHRNFRLYARNVSANAVTALFVMPCCASRVVSVAPIIANPKPDEMPRNKAASGAGSKYSRKPAGSRLKLMVVVDDERRMVGKALRLVNRFAPRGRGDGRRGDLVVDAPADIFLPRLAAVRPPGVLVGLVVQLAEHVDEAELVEHAREPGALLGQKARVLLVRAPVLEVDLLVRDIPVAAQDDLVAAIFQLVQMHEERLQETEFRRLAVRAGGAGRHVQRHHPELSEARFDVAPLAVELAMRKAAPHLVGRLAAIERDAAVTLFVRERVAGLIDLEAVQLGVEVGLLALHFLQTDDVGALPGEPAEQAFARRGTNSVDVEGDDPQAAGKADTPPCAADHWAGACRKLSTSAICFGSRWPPFFTTASTSHHVAR